MSRGLQEVIADILTHSGAVVEKKADGDVEVVVPPEVSALLGIPEYATLAFTFDRARSDAVYASYDSDLFASIKNLLGNKGMVAFASIEPYIPKLEKAAAQIAGRAFFENATFRPDVTETSDIAYLLAFFRFTALSDEKREGIVPVLINCINKSAVPIHDNAAGVLDLLKGNNEPKIIGGPALVEMVKPAYLAASGIVMEGMEDFIRGSERRLNRDVKRVYEYYETLKGETKKSIKKKEGADSERLAGKMEAIEGERKWKIHDLISKYALSIRVEPVSLIVIETGGAIFWINIKRRLASRRFPITFNPITRHFDPLPCESCFHPKGGYHVCDEKLHIVCSRCMKPCASCGREYCRACHKVCPKCKKEEKRQAQVFLDKELII